MLGPGRLANTVRQLTIEYYHMLMFIKTIKCQRSYIITSFFPPSDNNTTLVGKDCVT
jgi:hypothetical protein